MRKNIIVMLVMMICLSFFAIPVKADTVSFDITVNSKTAGASTDPYSKKTLKAGGSAYENKFYVTAKSVSNDKSICVFSVRVKKPEVTSEPIKINKSVVNKTKSSIYDSKKAPANEYYRLNSYLAPGSSGKVRVKGRYTP